MCGLTGGLTQTHFRKLLHALPVMTGQLLHRGPDDLGYWSDPECGIAFGHRRLAIVDLSPQGRQPMISSSGRYVLSFNGEIYNHVKLRHELDRSTTSNRWRGHSDTETLLAAIDTWGLRSALVRCTGMFAIALWDRRDRELTLVRDRMGEKPLYYGLQDGTLLFGSELKSLRAGPGFTGDINRDSLHLLLRHNYIPAPYSIYKGVSKLPAGMLVTIRLSDVLENRLPDPVAYWSVADAIAKGRADPFSGTRNDAANTLDTLLHDAVGQQMVADVPLGAFLSGGVDSSAIVAMMQSQSDRPVRTFTIGFHEAAYDEASHAHAVARHLGTEHTQLYLSEREAINLIPNLPTIYDEPFSDSSQIPTFLVSQLARAHVTVSLSGDGGDELFGGYNRYAWGTTLWRSVGWMPEGVRRLMAGSVLAVPPSAWDHIINSAGAFRPKAKRPRNPGDKLHKLATVLISEDANHLYRNLVSHWKEPASALLGGHEPVTALMSTSNGVKGQDFTERMMYMDQITYLPDDILVKLDRASMAVSLETRVPLLDHRVVEFAWSLPLAMKVRGRQTKSVLREVLYRYVPPEIIERPKTGFGIPLDAFLRGGLRDWAASLLDESRLRREGYFNPEPVMRKWREHLSGERNWSYDLWDILMFQAWLETQSD
jgi:asparagine synthase (glutamine-hydrolysing)